MNSTTISKYQTKSIPYLRKKAGEVFRAWIRNRDKGKPCVSCGSWNTSDAGHYYSAGNYPALEFNEQNTNLQCRKCNMFLSGNLLEYRKGLIKKIGVQEVEKLDMLVAQYKQLGYKHDRFTLISIIEKYR